MRGGGSNGGREGVRGGGAGVVERRKGVVDRGVRGRGGGVVKNDDEGRGGEGEQWW